MNIGLLDFEVRPFKRGRLILFLILSQAETDLFRLVLQPVCLQCCIVDRILVSVSLERYFYLSLQLVFDLLQSRLICVLDVIDAHFVFLPLELNLAL